MSIHSAHIQDALISNGCVIEGTVINSVLSPSVRVGKGAIIKDSVILNHTLISDGVEITRAIIDKRVIIGRNTKIGVFENLPNLEKPDLLDTGITVIEKGTVIPDHIDIGKNC